MKKSQDWWRNLEDFERSGIYMFVGLAFWVALLTVGSRTMFSDLPANTPFPLGMFYISVGLIELLVLVPWLARKIN